MSTPNLPTLEDVHAFLKSHYKHDRFEGRNSVWPKDAAGNEYSACVAKSALEWLGTHETGLISWHESASGKLIEYDRNLQIVSQS